MKWVLLVVAYAMFVLPYALVILAVSYVSIKIVIGDSFSKWLNKRGVQGHWNKLLTFICTVLSVAVFLFLFLLAGPDQHWRVW